MVEELEKFDIVLVSGNYGSGKSQLVEDHFRHRKRVDRHHIRHHLKEMLEHGKEWKPQDWDEDLEGLIKHIEHEIACHLMERDHKIVIVNTSLTKKSRKRYIEYAKKYGKIIACVFLNRDVSVLLKENRMRKFPVPDSVIVQQFTKTEQPTEDEGFNKIMFA